ncbi:DNA polymerase [Candidatus Bartonella raoultii]|uniref:DNA-directed DNA polymerase n=1 Tax=Bartonella raoultii TaxID=1457020 RepID=A0ABS7I8K8_9HYPH|nr:DNA polymerase [Bartonella raoultii]
MIPPLDLQDDQLLRPAYKGGFCFLNKNQDSLIKKEIEVYDVNSMYPAIMLNPLPIEKPIYVTGKIETEESILFVMRSKRSLIF